MKREEEEDSTSSSSSSSSDEEEEDDVVVHGKGGGSRLGEKKRREEEEEKEFEGAMKPGVSVEEIRGIFHKLMVKYRNVKLENKEYSSLYDKINQENNDLVEEIENLKDQMHCIHLKYRNKEKEIYKKIINLKTGQLVNALLLKEKEDSETQSPDSDTQSDPVAQKKARDLLHFKQNQEIILMNQRLREEINKIDEKLKSESKRMADENSKIKKQFEDLFVEKETFSLLNKNLKRKNLEAVLRFKTLNELAKANAQTLLNLKKSKQ